MPAKVGLPFKLKIITAASSAHYNDIVRIYNQAVARGLQTADENSVSLKEKLPWLKQHTGDHYVIYVACIDSKVVGYVALSPYRYGRAAFTKTAEISYYLDKGYQGKGLGTELIQYAIDQCSDLNIESLIAILLSCNLSSIAVLKKFKFVEWGSMPDIAKIKDKSFDHLYYGKHLT